MDKFIKVFLNTLFLILLLGFIGSCSVGFYKGNDDYKSLGAFLFFAMFFVALVGGESDKDNKEGK